MTKDVRGKQRKLGAHPPAKAEAGKAQSAAKAPPDDKQAQGKAAQADKMAAAKPGEFDKAGFIAAVDAAIAKQAPQNLDEAQKFGSSGKADAVKSEVSGKVTAGKKASAGAIESTTKAAPDTSKAKDKPVTPLAPDRPPETPAPPNPAQAVPDEAPAAAMDFSAGPKSMDDQMAEAQVTESQLATSNEPEFTGALKDKKEGEKHAATSPGMLRRSEGQTLTTAKANAASTGVAAMAAMATARRTAGAAVAAGKQGAKATDESKRAQVAGILQKVFDATKTEVEGILTGIDTLVDQRFSSGEKSARDAFTAEHRQKMKEYKDRRYSGLLGKGRWLKDKFMDLPAEANQIFVAARQGYVNRMREVISSVADVIATELNRAKARIAQGRQQLQAEVTKLPKDLQAVGKQAAGEFAGKFDELTESVDSKGSDLVQTLASKYQDALSKVDEEIEAEKEKNKGLISKAVDAVGGVIKTILELKDLLLGVLAKAAQAAMAIIKDPIRFLGNLVSAVGAGLQLFLSNLGEHLKKGLVSWLLGAASSMGIEIPKKFDLQGIITMMAGMLGLTWDAIKARVISRGIPAKVIEMAQGSLPIIAKLRSEGLAGIWELIAEKVGDLKEALFAKISGFLLPEVLKAGIFWILSLLNPASAFVKACKMIIDIITFIVTRGKQIVEFVNAVLDAVIAIAAGGVAQVPALIQNALARSIPVLIGALAAILGVGGIADKVKKFIQSLSKPIMKAVDWVTDKIVGVGKKIWGKIKSAGKKLKDQAKAGVGKIKDRLVKAADRRTPDQKQKDLDAGLDAADRLVAAKLTEDRIRARLPEIKARYRMTSLELVVDSVAEVDEQVHVKGEVNPGGSRAQKPIPKAHGVYDPTTRTVPQLWNDCTLKNRFSGSETAEEAADRVTKAKQALIATGLLAPNLDALLAHDGGSTPRPFVSVVAEDNYGGHTVLKHVKGGGVVADEAALATRILLGVPPPRPVDIASYFVSESEATAAVALAIDDRLRANWKNDYRRRLASSPGTEIQVPLGGVGYGLRIDPAVAQSNDKPSYMAGGTYRGPMYPGDPRAANPALPPMTMVAPLTGVLVTIAVDTTAPGGWYVVRAFPTG